MAQKWTQKEITAWSQEQFGNPPVGAVANRMGKEIREFYTALEAGDLDAARAEVPDIEIMLRQCAELLDVDLDKAVDEKMDINKARTWARTADGDYQHVE